MAGTWSRYMLKVSKNFREAVPDEVKVTVKHTSNVV